MSILQPGVVVAGKYEISRLVASGGMGSVWRARHLLLDIDVAVKLMAPTLASSPEQRTRFAREAKAAAQLKSPHVVQIHDYGVDGDAPYIVMELLDGEDLGARLRREKKLSPAAAAVLLKQVGRGLRKAHEMGIVHRDLKPANIFLSRGDDEEVVKLLDFGIARAMASRNAGETTNTGDILGSPPYMSPEQVRGLKSLDHRTDQWSLGVVLYRVLTGRLPFQSEQTGDLIVKICTESPPPPSSLAPELPPALDGFFWRVFEREPDARFASVREMVDAYLAAIAPPPQPAWTPQVPAGFPAAPPPAAAGRSTVRLQPPPAPIPQQFGSTMPMPLSVPAGGWQPSEMLPARASQPSFPPISAPSARESQPSFPPISAPPARLPEPSLPPTSAPPARAPQPSYPLMGVPPARLPEPSVSSLDGPLTTGAPVISAAVTAASLRATAVAVRPFKTDAAARLPLRVRTGRTVAPWFVGAIVALLVGGVAAAVAAFRPGGEHEGAAAEPGSAVAPSLPAPGPTMLLAADAPAVVPAPVVAAATASGSASGAAPAAASAPSPGVATVVPVSPRPPASAQAASPAIKVPYSGNPYGASGSATAAVPTAPAASGPAPSSKATTSPSKEKRVEWD